MSNCAKHITASISVVLLKCKRTYPTLMHKMLPSELGAVVPVHVLIRVEHDAADSGACGGPSNACNTTNSAEHYAASTACCGTANSDADSQLC